MEQMERAMHAVVQAMKNESFSVNELLHISNFATKLKESTDRLILSNSKLNVNALNGGVDMAAGKSIASVQIGSSRVVKDMIHILGVNFDKEVRLRVKEEIVGREPTGNHSIIIEWPDNA